jgi:hypothetical protein
VVYGTDPTSQADKTSGYCVADPDAEPRLPPGKAIGDHSRRYHPRVLLRNEPKTVTGDSFLAHDIERVGNPEADKVPRAPLPSCWLDRLQIKVGQHQLGVGESRLRLDRQLSGPYFGLRFASHSVCGVGR